MADKLAFRPEIVDQSGIANPDFVQSNKPSMVVSIWAAIMASRATKIGSGIIAGGSTFALVMNMFGARLDDLDKKLEAKDREIRSYVDFKHDAVLLQLQFMNVRQVEMNDMLKVISQRMYDEKHKTK